MTEFADLIAQPGERHLIYGGTRAGKSSFIDWQVREIQRTRPDCMQILVDSKPRFRAETERGWSGPKADAASHGATSIGERVRLSRIPAWLTSMQITLFVGSGQDREKWQSCSLAMPKTGSECFSFSKPSSKRRLVIEKDTYTLTKCLTSTEGTHTAS